jgi:hypothetical protein
MTFGYLKRTLKTVKLELNFNYRKWGWLSLE